MASPLLAQHPPDALVAIGARGPRSAAELLTDATRIAVELPEPEAGRHVLLIFRGDRYACMASLLAALSRGHCVALPYDTSRETVLALAERPETQVVLHDTLSGAPVRVDKLLEQAPATETSLELPSATARLRFFAPDERGELRGRDTSLERCIEEARALADELGLTPSDRVLGGVTPGHPYGFALTILAPLLYGAATLREDATTASQLAAHLDASHPGVWVSVPSQLEALPANGEAPAGLRAVVTAVEPAGDALLTRSAQRLGASITELWDDPEHGHLFARAGTGPANPIAGVAVRPGADGRLWVRAPWLAGGVEEEHGTPLRVEPEGDGFRHCGRAQDWLSVQGERVFVPDVLATLRQLEGVRDAALLAPFEGPHAGQALIAVASDTPGGALEAAVRQALHLDVGRVLVVDALPRNALGSLRREALWRRFGLHPDGTPLRLELDWGRHEREQTEHGARDVFHVRIPEDYAYFDGHFPGYPILPGAAQLGELVMPCIRRARPDLGDLGRMTRLKFLGRIVPGSDVQVVLTHKLGESALDFALMRDATTCAAGRLDFGGEAGP